MSVSQHIQRPAVVRVLPALLSGFVQAALALALLSPAYEAAAQNPAAQNRNLTVQQAQTSSESQPRVALIIGNSNYSKADTLPQLKNPTNDARDIAEALKSHGFSNVSLVVDANYRTMREAITKFGDELKKAGPTAVGLFYYAGHGVQDSGHNYLVPLGTQLGTPKDLEFEAVDAQRVLAYMEDAGNAVNIIILDACRDNPFPVLNKFRSAAAPAAGLAQMRAPSGSFIAFAAAEGQRASDGDGRNGLFTQQFLQSLRDPDSNIDAVFTRVTATVSDKTGKAQVPWRNSSLTSSFYFNPNQRGPLGGGSEEMIRLQQEQQRQLEADRKRLEEESAAARARLDEERRQQQEERRQQQARLEEERRLEASRAEQERQRARAQAELERQRQQADLERERERDRQERERRSRVNIPFTP
jgi:hypothetical protein